MKLFDQEIDGPFLLECSTIGCPTAIVIVVLEALSWDSEWYAKLRENKKIRDLYKGAIVQNILLLLVLGPLFYGAVAAYLDSLTTPCWPWFVSIPAAVSLEGLSYTLLHVWMHRPSNFWIHKYHHLYNEKTFVRPISANAVSIVEMTLAYLIPLVVAVLSFHPSKNDVFCVISIISFCNVFVHTPESVLPLRSWVPGFFCSNYKHFIHHEKNLKKHYSAPVIDFDWAADLVFGSNSSGKEQPQQQKSG